MSKENEYSEDELWVRIKETEGAERVDTLLSLSYIAIHREDHKECLALCESARDLYESLGAEANTATLAHIYNGIGWSLKYLNRPIEAAHATERAVDLYREIGSGEVVNALRNEASCWHDAKDYEKSLEYYRKALAEPNTETIDFNVGRDYYYCATTLIKLKKWQEALDNFLTARKIFQKDHEPMEVAFCDEEIAYCYNRLNNGTEAEHYARKALDFAVTADCNERLFWAKIRLGNAYKVQERYEIALDTFREGLAIILKSDSPNWYHIVGVEDLIATVLTAQGKTEEADEITRRLATLKETLEEVSTDIA